MRRLLFLISVLLVLPSPSWAAIAHVQSSPSNATGAGTTVVLTFGGGVTAGNVIWITARVGNETFTLTPTMTGVTFSTIVGPTAYSGAANFRTYLWCGQVDTGTATQLTVTSSSSGVISGVAAEFSGTTTCAATIDETGGGEVAAGTAHDITGTMDTDVANDLIIGACSFGAASGANTVGANLTAFDANDTDTRPFAQYRIVAATGSYSVPMTSTNAVDSECVSAAQEIAAAGGGTAGRGLLMGVGP